MLATGGSLGGTINFLVNRGADHITCICLIAAPPEGIERVQELTEDLQVPCTLVVAGIDDHLDDHATSCPASAMPGGTGCTGWPSSRTPGGRAPQLSTETPTEGAFSMATLVVGGAGYIGAHVVRLLADDGQDIVVIDDLSTSTADRIGSVPLVRFDVAAEGATARIVEVIRDHDVDAVIHFAARKQVGESVAKPLYYYQQNIGGMVNLLAAMEETGGQEDDLLLLRRGLRRARGGRRGRGLPDRADQSVRPDQADRRVDPGRLRTRLGG